jgi:hypothetical protein
MTFSGQHLDSIRIEPDITLMLEYSEPDQGGTRLLQRFYISHDKEVEVEVGYSHDESFQRKQLPVKDVPQQVFEDASDWVTQQLECLPSGRILDVLKRFQEAFCSENDET